MTLARRRASRMQSMAEMQMRAKKPENKAPKNVEVDTVEKGTIATARALMRSVEGGGGSGSDGVW